MKVLLVERTSCRAAAAAILLGLCMGAAHASSVNKDGYLTDQRGNLVRNSYNECWKTGYWTPAMAITECDPNLVKKEDIKLAPPAPDRATETNPAPAPAVAPPPAVLAAPPLKQTTTFSAVSLFDFDKANLRPDGKKILDDFAQKLKGVSYDTITVIGHASRIGTASYNMKLSERRAKSVKAYLVNPGGIDSSKIKTAWKGMTEPVTKPGQCKGNKATRKLIACLQPDRRVEVVISGLK